MLNIERPLILLTYRNKLVSGLGKNFPNNTPDNPFKGMVEELGELAHALLKKEQGIRGTPEEHDVAAKDAVGDLVVYMADFCERRGWNLQEIVETTWNVVKQRDWTKNKHDGVQASGGSGGSNNV